MQEMQEEASCQMGAIEPQGENEGIWTTVKEYARVRRRITSMRTIYDCIEKGVLKSKKISGSKTLVFVEDSRNIKEILRLRELKKDAPKPIRKINPDHIRHFKLVFPDFDPEQFNSFLDIISNPSLITEKCDRINYSQKYVIDVNVDTYNIIKGKAKEHNMKAEDMMKDMIYRILLEQSQKSKEAVK